MTLEEKRDYYITFNRFQQSREKAYTPLFKKVLRQQQQYFIDAVNAGATYDVALINIPFAPMYELDKKLYIDSGRVYAGKVRLSIMQQVNRQKKGMQPIGFNERMVQLINQYFAIDLLNTVNDITQTTKDNIQKVLMKATELGWGFDKIVDEITNDELNTKRARVIARTETVTAANQGAMFAAQATGLELNKEWLSALDNRTRYDHKEVNGQTVGLNDTFNVGGYPMKQPGDRTNAPAKEIVNCRCTVLFIPIE